MSGVSLPVSRPMGRALVVGGDACRAQPARMIQRLGFTCAESENPYAAMYELCTRPLAYRAMVLSLQTVYREELALIGAVKRRFPHIEIWLTQTDGRQSSLADAMRQGADGLLDEEGLHRTATGAPLPLQDPPVPSAQSESTRGEPAREAVTPPQAFDMGEPILSADELRALLHDQTYAPDPDE